MVYHRILTIVSCAIQYIILNTVLYAIPLRASQVMPVVKNQPANAGDIRDAGSIPGSGNSSGGGNGNPLQYSCLEHPRDRVVWWTVVHGITKSWTQLKLLSKHACYTVGLCCLSILCITVCIC